MNSFAAVQESASGAHRSRNRRLRHPALTQQHHLDALALRDRYLPPQRSFQPPHLGFAAFDHLLPRIRWRKRITPRGGKQPHYLSKISIQAVMDVYQIRFSARDLGFPFVALEQPEFLVALMVWI
jgi:hypothetical protein